MNVEDVMATVNNKVLAAHTYAQDSRITFLTYNNHLKADQLQFF